MDKKSETIKCRFVSTAESEEYLQKNNLQNKLSTIDCNFKVKNNMSGDDLYTYYNGNAMIKYLENVKQENRLKSATQHTLPDCKNCVGKYREYTFCYDDIKLFITVPVVSISDKIYSVKDLIYFNEVIGRLDSLAEITIRLRKSRTFKRIVSGIAIAGTLAAGVKFFIQTAEKQKEHYLNTNVYDEYYKDIISKDRFEELVENIQKSHEKSAKGK